MSNKFTVLFDTREQHPIVFPSSEFCEGSFATKLDTGDYTIRGYEDVVTIERKGNVSELAKNLCEARFERELERLNKFRFAYILCEFSLSQVLAYPQYSNIPEYMRDKIKISGPYILRKSIENEMKFGVRTVFCDSSEGVRLYMTSIFKRILEAYQRVPRNAD